jgi:hypothetical protein
MPRPKSWKPGHLLHKSSGRAYVVLDGGPPIYLGKYGTQESRDKYDQIIGEWIARGRVAETKKAAPDGTTSACVVTVSHVCWSFWQYALRTYPTPPANEGKRPQGELRNYWDVLRPLQRLFGDTPAADFKGVRLNALRDEMIRMGWCRNVINRNISRVKFIFAKAVELELVPGETYAALAAVPGLRKGHPSARRRR